MAERNHVHQLRWFRIDGIENPAIGLFIKAFNHEDAMNRLDTDGKPWNSLSQQEQRNYHTNRLGQGSGNSYRNTHR